MKFIFTSFRRKRIAQRFILKSNQNKARNFTINTLVFADLVKCFEIGIKSVFYDATLGGIGFEILSETRKVGQRREAPPPPQGRGGGHSGRQTDRRAAGAPRLVQKTKILNRDSVVSRLRCVRGLKISFFASRNMTIPFLIPQSKILDHECEAVLFNPFQRNELILGPNINLTTKLCASFVGPQNEYDLELCVNKAFFNCLKYLFTKFLARKKKLKVYCFLLMWFPLVLFGQNHCIDWTDRQRHVGSTECGERVHF